MTVYASGVPGSRTSRTRVWRVMTPGWRAGVGPAVAGSGRIVGLREAAVEVVEGRFADGGRADRGRGGAGVAGEAGGGLAGGGRPAPVKGGVPPRGRPSGGSGGCPGAIPGRDAATARVASRCSN